MMKLLAKSAAGAKWMLLLTKRLLKKPAFTVILILIPVLAISMSRASEKANGLLTVCVATNGERDAVAEEVMKSFEEGDSVVLFKIFESAEDAVTEVKRGRADAAWILPGNLREVMTDYCKYSEPIVSVYEREESAFMALSREIMYGKLFPHISKIYSADYTEDWLGDADGYSEERFLEFYEKMAPSEDEIFIEFQALGGMGSSDTTESNHLKSPIRGLLAVLVVMCGLASAVTVSADMEKGTFSWLDEKKHIWVYHASGTGACVLAAMVSVVSLKIGDMTGNLAYEILTALLFAVSSALFCSVVAIVMKTPKRIAASIPPLTIIMLVLSPVFIRIADTPFQHILPTYTYIYSSVSASYTWIMCIYIPIALLISVLLSAAIKNIGKRAHYLTKK